MAGDGAEGRAQGQPGNHGGCPRLQMETPSRAWPGILWLQTRIPGGCIRHGQLSRRHCLQRAEEAAWSHPSAFAGQQPAATASHKSLRRERTSAQISVTRPQLLHIASAPEEKALATSSCCWRSSSSSPGAQPAWALQEQPGAVSGSVWGAGDGTGLQAQPLPPNAVPCALCIAPSTRTPCSEP